MTRIWHNRPWLIVGGLVLSLLTIWLMLAVSTTVSVSSLLKARNLPAAADQARRAQRLVQPLTFLTLGLVPDLELWQKSLALVEDTQASWDQISQSAPGLLAANPPQDAPLALIAQEIATWNTKVTEVAQLCPQTWIVRFFGRCSQLNKAAQTSQDATTLSQWLSQDHTFIIIFQNTEELRATGGFMGSYAKVEIQNGAIQNLVIEDIYEPDGQFQGYVEPPAGVKEFLSSGNGLRLPDANWHPDLPTSAQTILSYFAWGREEQIDGLVMVNSDLVEKLLQVTGELYLPDYGMTVTAENFTTLARADREQFFPGSQQKTNFLSHVFQVLKYEVTQLSPKQQLAVGELLWQSTQDKTIQMFALNPEVQTLLSQYQVAGELTRSDQTPFWLYLLESNVGINKANRDVTRTVTVSAQGPDLVMAIDFVTGNLPYANYQRLLLNPGWRVKQISLGGTTIETWDESIITAANGSEWQQLGLLVPVRAQSRQTLEITLTTDHPQWLSQPKLWLIKQPGLAPTPYAWGSKPDQQLLLERDTLIAL